MIKNIKNCPLTLFVNNGPNFVNSRPGVQPWKIQFSLIQKLMKTQKKESHFQDPGNIFYQLTLILSRKRSTLTPLTA